MTTTFYVVLTPQQAPVLEALHTVGPCNLKELKALVGLGQTYLHRAYRELLDLELLTTDIGNRPKKMNMSLTISDAGRRALERYRRQAELAAQDIVPPPTYNTGNSVYQPTHRSYYRNEGNKHIASAGVSC